MCSVVLVVSCLLVSSSTAFLPSNNRSGASQDATSTRNYADQNGITTPTYVTTTTTAASRQEPECFTYMNKDQGSLLIGSERVIVKCQCISKSDPVQPCPDWKFITGEEYVFVEEQLFDASTKGYCSVTYKFQVRTDLKVGRKTIEAGCFLPNVDGPVDTFYVYLDSPVPSDSSSKTRLTIYMIFAIVCFMVLMIALFGFLFRWQVRNRRRSQRATACRNPFVYSSPDRHGFYPPAANAGYVHDNPPTYNEATILTQNAGQTPAQTCPVGGTTLQERIEKITGPVQDK